MDSLVAIVSGDSDYANAKWGVLLQRFAHDLFDLLLSFGRINRCAVVDLKSRH